MSQIIVIPDKCLQSSAWHQRTNSKSGSVSYAHFYKNILFKYYPASHRLILDRRLVNASISPDKVTNLDQLMAGISEVSVKQIHSETGHITYHHEAHSQTFLELAAEINQHLSDLIGTEINILYFQVINIEICFNVTTSNVSQYIELFNMMFTRRNPKSQVNFVLEMNKPLHGSYYTKAKSQFKKNKAYGLVTNFYNKIDQLTNRQNDAIKKARARDSARLNSRLKSRTKLSDKVNRPDPSFNIADSDITFNDMEKANNTLRLEVKLGHKILYNLFGTEPRPFILFLDQNYCKDFIEKSYNRMCGLKKSEGLPMPKELDYYSLEKAIAIINTSSLSDTRKNNLIETAKKLNIDDELATITSINNNDRSEQAVFDRYKNNMRSLGMHWLLIPPRMELDSLESPLKLLENQLKDLGSGKEKYSLRQLSSQLEAQYANEIEITDEETIIIEDNKDDSHSSKPDSSDPIPVSLRVKAIKK